MPPPPTGDLLLIARDPPLRRRMQRIASAAGFALLELPAPDAVSPAHDPVAIVVELEVPGAVQAVSEWKRRWPRCLVAGSVAIPNQELWIGAQAAGYDLVANRGALPRQLERLLSERRQGAPAGQRLKAKAVAGSGDGLIGRVPDAPDGPIVIFRVGHRLCAFRDACPHAGMSLADGTLEGSVITCPAHGSQFDVCSGERIRGPADFPVQTYRVSERDGELYVEVRA